MSNIFDSGKYFSIKYFNMRNIFDSSKYSTRHLAAVVYKLLMAVFVFVNTDKKFAGIGYEIVTNFVFRPA